MYYELIKGSLRSSVNSNLKEDRMKPDGRKRNLLAGFCAALFLLAIPCLVVAEESDYGYVIVTTDADDATLYVDGAYAGKLPMLDTLKLPVGKHLLSFLPGSRTSKLYPIGDDIPTLITTTKETEVEYPGFHVHVTLVGGGTATDLYKNDDKGKKKLKMMLLTKSRRMRMRTR